MTTLKTSKNEEALSFWPWLIIIAGIALSVWGFPHLIARFSLGWLAGPQAAWYLVRATGIVAYLLMVASTVWGLLLSTKLLQQAVPPAVSLAMHNYLSWSALVLSIGHALLLLFDTYYTYTLAHLLIPFIGPYSPLWVGFGIIGFYIILFTPVSFYYRKQIGQKRWRTLHYLTFVAFGLATGHGLMAGTDATQLGGLYLASGLSVGFLTIYRVLEGVGKKYKSLSPARARS